MTSSSSSSQSSSTPPCLQWARTLSSLLEDREGAELFKAYVEQEGGIHKERLNFYFACEGLKQESDPEKTKKIIGLIYSKILKKSDLHVPNEVKQLVKAGLKDEVPISPRIYDQMQKDVKRIIQETTYPNFLQSEMYLSYVQHATQGCASSSSISGSIINSSECQIPQVLTSTTTAASSLTISEASSKFILSRSSTLPTLIEEGDGSSLTDLAEGAIGFSNEPKNRAPLNASSTKIPLSLTKDALMATQRRRLEMRSPG
jgi:axin 1